VSIEERVRAATRARTELVHDVRPLEFTDELPARARRNDRPRRWLTWGAPIGAAALVTVLALVLVLVRQAPAPQANVADPTPVAPTQTATVTAPIPRYYVALAYVNPGSSSPIEAAVGDDQTGRKLAVIAPSASQNFYGVTAAADDRTFVLMNYNNAQQETTFYLLRLTPGAAHPTQLTELPIRGIVAHVSGLALSPDGRELAVMYRFATTGTNASTHLLIYSMSSGAELAAWNTAGPNDNALGGDPNSEGLSWINGDRSVDFGWIATAPSARGPGTLQVRTVDVTPGGHDLLADSRLVLSVPPGVSQGGHFSQPCERWLATSDGRAIVCGGAGGNGTTFACPAVPPSFVSYSTATGKPLQVLYRYQGPCVNGQALLAWINSSGSQAIGFILMDKVVNGKNTPVPNLFGVAAGGRFTPLPALPFHQDAVTSAGGLAF
jgi:hypothetical protein